MLSPSDVHQFEPEKIDSDDEKARGYVVMTELGAARRSGTVAYASTKPTHRIAGAEAVIVAGRPDDDPPNGFLDTTFVYPGILYAVESAKVGRYFGTLSQQEFGNVVRGVPAGIGYRKGSIVPSAGAQRGSGLRGIVVRFSPEWEAQVLFRYAVILTPYPYSVAGYAFQLVVPLLLNPRSARAPNVELSPAPWYSELKLDDGRAVTRVVAAVEAISSVKQGRLGGVPNAICTDADLERVEDGLLTWLGTPLPSANVPNGSDAQSARSATSEVGNVAIAGVQSAEDV